MANIYLSHPDILEVDTVVVRYRVMDDGSPAIVVAANPVRPAGGGQPADRGVAHTDQGSIPITAVIKHDGETWLVMPCGAYSEGDPIGISVDPARRRLLSQAHTFTHLMMAGAREVVPGYTSKGADIDDDGVSIELRFLSSVPVTPDMVREIDRRTRSRILNPLPVLVERARSVEEAAAHYPNWRVDPDLNLSGKVRVIVIAGIDANPCSGSHVSTTGDIGPYTVKDHTTSYSNLNKLHINKVNYWPD